jgi:3-hydroxybutyryl-CoA dehydrogenase
MTAKPMNTKYTLHQRGTSRSFPDANPFLKGGTADAEIAVLVGEIPQELPSLAGHVAVLVELGVECLAVHTGGCDEPESSNVVGFARWRLGRNEPSDLVELVAEPGCKASAVAAARALFEEAGFEVSVCADRMGRIVDRLMRPQFNLALRAVDDGLASPKDLEQCLKLGLGYRNGLLEPLLASGLEHHYQVTSALFETYGHAMYAPARRAVVEHTRRSGKAR